MKKNLQQQYEQVVADYIEVFCNKQGLNFEYWVGDDIGGIADFGCIYFFNFDDIRLDIDTNQPENQIINWIEETIENANSDAEKMINYRSWCMGLRYEDIKE